jgi:hypothetical protein
MRRVTAMVSAAAVVLWMATAFAQGPNLSGTWTRDMPAGAPAGGGAAGGGGGGGQRGGGMGGGGGAFNCGAECTIVMDAKTVTIKRPANAQTGTTPADIVLNVTGVTKLEQPGRGGAAPTPYEVTAKVDGAKWVVTRTMDMQGTSITNTQTISIEGGKLTVVTTSTREGAAPQTATYTKK